MVSAGSTNPEIAAAVFLSRKTVERHVSNILAKLGMRNRAELAALSVEPAPTFPHSDGRSSWRARIEGVHTDEPAAAEAYHSSYDLTNRSENDRHHHTEPGDPRANVASTTAGHGKSRRRRRDRADLSWRSPQRPPAFDTKDRPNYGPAAPASYFPCIDEDSQRPPTLVTADATGVAANVTSPGPEQDIRRLANSSGSVVRVGRISPHPGRPVAAMTRCRCRRRRMQNNAT